MLQHLAKLDHFDGLRRPGPNKRQMTFKKYDIMAQIFYMLVFLNDTTLMLHLCTRL
jgi:hypothetical protein